MTKALLFCLLIAGAQAACSKMDNYEGPKTTVNDQDRQFLIDAGHGNLAEVDAGSLAAAKGANAGVRSFGEMMVRDHGEAEDALKRISDGFNIPVPDKPDSAHQVVKQYLMTLSGMVFDTVYLNNQVSDHQKMILLYQQEMDKGNDTSIKGYASSHLPVITGHKAMADSLLHAILTLDPH